jgi:carboxyl-terminal processing protease
VVHKRAILVGERTHGKGSVQEITHYPGGGAQLKYTMAYYYLPSGQRVESQDAMKKQGRADWGVGPNIEVDLTSEELRKMLSVQRENDVLVQADRSNSGHEVKKYNIEETLAADPQLAVGVLAVKTKLIQADSIPVRSY